MSDFVDSNSHRNPSKIILKIGRVQSTERLLGPLRGRVHLGPQRYLMQSLPVLTAPVCAVWRLSGTRQTDEKVAPGQLEGERGRAGSPAPCRALTVRLQLAGLAAAAARLVDGLDDEDVLGATLQPVHSVVVLLDVGHDHPAVRRVTQTCNADTGQTFGTSIISGYCHFLGSNQSTPVLRVLPPVGGQPVWLIAYSYCVL